MLDIYFVPSRPRFLAQLATGGVHVRNLITFWTEKKEEETESANTHSVDPHPLWVPYMTGVLMGSQVRLLSPADSGSSGSDKDQWDSLSQWLQSAAAQQGLAGPISCSNRSPNSLMCHLLRSHAPNCLSFSSL